MSCFISDATPDFLFASTEAGTITYSGGCTSSTTAVVAGDNRVTFDTLAEGEYANCEITVTDAVGNVSEELDVPDSTVDTTAPTLEVPTAQTVVQGQSGISLDIRADDGTGAGVSTIATSDLFGLGLSLSGSGDSWTIAGDIALDAAVREHTVTVTATDAVGNAHSESFTITVQGAGTNLVSIAAAEATEGETITFTVTMGTALSEQVIVPWQTESHADATSPASAGDDYTAASGTLGIAPGDTMGTITVATAVDNLAEGPETFVVRLTGVAGGPTLGTTQAVGTIDDDDPLTVRIEALDAGAVAEGDESLIVTLTDASTDKGTVSLSNTDTSATATIDDDELLVSVAAGAPVDEGREHLFTVRLRTPGGEAATADEAVTVAWRTGTPTRPTSTRYPTSPSPFPRARPAAAARSPSPPSTTRSPRAARA